MNARREGWPASVIALHWIGAALMLGLIALGFAMRRAGLSAATVFDLFQQHKSLGFLAMAVTAARLAARCATRAPGSRAKGAERALATGVQATLYLLSLAAFASGWLAISSSPIPVPTRIFGLVPVPGLVRPNLALYSASTCAHATVAYAILGLALLHAAGALKHHIRDRDDTLTRMLGRTSRVN